LQAADRYAGHACCSLASLSCSGWVMPAANIPHMVALLRSKGNTHMFATIGKMYLMFFQGCDPQAGGPAPGLLRMNGLAACSPVPEQSTLAGSLQAGRWLG
jgi:hypothetical protein